MVKLVETRKPNWEKRREELIMLVLLNFWDGRELGIWREKEGKDLMVSLRMENGEWGPFCLPTFTFRLVSHSLLLLLSHWKKTTSMVIIIGMLLAFATIAKLGSFNTHRVLKGIKKNNAKLKHTLGRFFFFFLTHILQKNILNVTFF